MGSLRSRSSFRSLDQEEAFPSPGYLVLQRISSPSNKHEGFLTTPVIDQHQSKDMFVRILNGHRFPQLSSLPNYGSDFKLVIKLFARPINNFLSISKLSFRSDDRSSRHLQVSGVSSHLMREPNNRIESFNSAQVWRTMPMIKTCLLRLTHHNRRRAASISDREMQESRWKRSLLHNSLTSIQTVFLGTREVREASDIYREMHRHL
jgi:hypothetical protein